MIFLTGGLAAAAVGLAFADLREGGLWTASWIASIAEWLPPALVGLVFTLLGALKLFGVYRGIVGGHDKPFVVQLCGT